jgi:diadenosine tetraphosphate (Ap4A) HIT family hydrolase
LTLALSVKDTQYVSSFFLHKQCSRCPASVLVANADNLLQLIIPKYHGAKLHDIPDDQLAEVLSVAKRIAIAQDIQNYNILQNNGKIAHQVVDHVHFHLIPKPNEQEGLGISWPTKQADMGELNKLLEDIKSKM